jgi:hypothetical protein
VTRPKETPRAPRKTGAERPGRVTKASAQAGRRVRSQVSGKEQLPDYNAVSVGRVVRRVEILSVDLVGANFSRADDEPLPVPMEDAVPEMGFHPEWALSRDGQVLGCAVTFGTIFEKKDEPYNVTARFRLLYSISPGEPLDSADLAQFAAWNAVFNAWPYWREYVSSTINRAHLPQFIVPVMRVPRPEPPSPPPDPDGAASVAEKAKLKAARTARPRKGAVSGSGGSRA